MCCCLLFRHVLTAAHCMDAYPFARVRVRIGAQGLAGASGVKRRVVKVALPAEWSPSRPTQFDLAVLQLDRPVTSVEAVKLPPPSLLPPEPGSVAQVLGYGLSEAGQSERAGSLRAARVPLTEPFECHLTYSTALSSTVFCAGWDDGRSDACVGDSGGPLVVGEPPTQIGLVSWGHSCGKPYYFGVYTRISNFTQFLDRILGCPACSRATECGVVVAPHLLAKRCS